MEKKSFFGDNGLTSTSANHIANLAKEYVRNAQEKLSAVRFYSEKVGVLDGKNEILSKKGLTEEYTRVIPDIIDRIAECHSLIAFLREAIKEKERLALEAEHYTDKEAWDEIDMTKKAIKELIPDSPTYPTIDDIKAEWSIGEQEKYLTLEATAAAIGKQIHEDGCISNARIDLMKKLQDPVKLDLNGSDTIYHKYEATTSLEVVDEVYNSLQAKYRSVQAELNGMKKKLEDEVTKRTLAINEEHAIKMKEYDVAKGETDSMERQVLEKQALTRAKLLEEVKNLKIVIPKRLTNIYEILKNL